MLGSIVECVLNVGPMVVIGLYAKEAENVDGSALMRTPFLRLIASAFAHALLPLHTTVALVLASHKSSFQDGWRSTSARGGQTSPSTNLIAVSDSGCAQGGAAQCHAYSASTAPSKDSPISGWRHYCMKSSSVIERRSSYEPRMNIFQGIESEMPIGAVRASGSSAHRLFVVRLNDRHLLGKRQAKANVAVDVTSATW